MKKKRKEVLVIAGICFILGLFVTTGCGLCYSCGQSAPGNCLTACTACVATPVNCLNCVGCGSFCTGCMNASW